MAKAKLSATWAHERRVAKELGVSRKKAVEYLRQQARHQNPNFHASRGPEYMPSREKLIEKLTQNFTNEQLAWLIERLAEDRDLISDMVDATVMKR